MQDYAHPAHGPHYELRWAYLCQWHDDVRQVLVHDLRTAQEVATGKHAEYDT